MLLEIQHQTRYRYDKPISLEPQHFYFHPLSRNYYNIQSFELNTSPVAKAMSERIDLENNTFHQGWFDRELTQLEIQASMTIETRAFNPFDFLVEAKSKTTETRAENPFLHPLPISAELKHWTDQIKECHDQTTSLLSDLCSKIHDDWTHEARYDDSLLQPNACFAEKQGSCRDLSWMLIAMLRYLHFPARFVSGYSFNPELGEGHELHAWVEVFLHGGGWIGVDPSSGLFTTEYYIPVATSYHPANTLPVQGVYRGNANSELETSVQIKIF